MPRVALLTIHGMGDTTPDPATPLKQRLRERLGSKFNDVAFVPVHCPDLLRGHPQQVWDEVDRQAKVHYDDLRKFLLFGLAELTGFAARSDRPGSVYETVQAAIAQALLDARRQLDGDGPVVAITHGLGAQALSCYLYDAQKAAAGRPVDAGLWRGTGETVQALAGSAEARRFLSGGTLRRWISTGCNIPVFVAADRQMDIRPITPPADGFRWLNLYDPDDVLGWPLQPLSAGYRALVEDRQLHSGQGLTNWVTRHWSPAQPSGYWDDDDVLTPLATYLREFL